VVDCKIFCPASGAAAKKLFSLSLWERERERALLGPPNSSPHSPPQRGGDEKPSPMRHWRQIVSVLDYFRSRKFRRVLPFCWSPSPVGRGKGRGLNSAYNPSPHSPPPGGGEEKGQPKYFAMFVDVSGHDCFDQLLLHFQIDSQLLPEG
jgi:hypothetical protein